MRALELQPPPAADTTEIEDPQPAAGLAAAAPAEASEPAPRPGALEPRSEPSPEAAPTVETVAAAPAPPPVELSPSPPAVPAEPGAAQALPASAEAPLTPAAGNVSPVYPPDMLEKGIEGVVNLKVVVSESGDVEDVQVLSGAEPFATAASSAVRSWRFSPYLLDGRPAVARFVLRVPFRLRQR
jgi:protein TonB